MKPNNFRDDQYLSRSHGKRSGVKKSMRNRIVRAGAKQYDQNTLNQNVDDAGWEGLKVKEIEFFFS